MTTDDPKGKPPPQTGDGPDEPLTETDSVLAVSAAGHGDILADLEDEEALMSDSDIDMDELVRAAAEIEEEERRSNDSLPAVGGGDDDEGNTADPAASAEDLTYFDIVWAQFRKNRVAVAALWVLGGLLSLAVFSPVIASNQPLLWDAGEGLSSPWIESLFNRNFFENPVDVFFNLLMVMGTPLLIGWFVRIKQIQRRGLPKRARRRRIRNEAFAALALIIAVFVVLLVRDSSSKYIKYPQLEAQLIEQGTDVFSVYPLSKFTARETGFRSAQPPTWFRLFRSHERPGDDLPLLAHVLGTDESTRDVTVRILYGIRISLTIGVIAVGIYVFIGILLGATAGYFGGRVDMVIQRMIEIMMSVPSFFVILTIVAFIDHRSIFHIMVILGLIRWTTVARLVRGEFLRLRNLEFVTAAKALGFPEHKIIFAHILPNALGPVLVSATFGVAACILIEASLSFLGLGDLTAPSWGQMIQEGYSTGAWHLILVPGIAIFATVSALNLVGEGLRDALDPRLRQ